MSVALEAATASLANEPLHSRVDALIDAKLPGRQVAALADDAEFFGASFSISSDAFRL